MAQAGMFSASELQPLLADGGIELSVSQVHRLVTGIPERLNLPVLAALCDPRSILTNFTRSKSLALLASIARGERPLSHETLDEHAGAYAQIAFQ